MYDPETDEYYRNAAPTVHDHTGAVVRSPYPMAGPAPAQGVHVVAPLPPGYGPSYPAPVPYGQPYPYPQQQQAIAPYGAPGMGMCGPNGYTSLYQKHQQAKVLKTIGVVVDVLGQTIAAIMPVPAAPTIIGVSATDDENMKRYQQALANHAKTDERIRTVAKVVREALNTVKQL